MSSFVRRLAAIPWRHIAGDALSRVFLVAQAFCAVHVVDHHVCSLAIVRGPSMLPAMNLAGDVVAVDRVSVRLGRVSRGDVVLMISPEDPRKAVAKRVVGMEGDAVSYLVDPGNSDASSTVVVPRGHVWVQGDNIYASRDSRQFGAVPYGLITGKIFCRENIRFEIQLPCSSNTCLTHEPNATESSCVGHTPRTLWLQVCPPGECGIIDSDCSIIGLATEGFWFD